MPDKDNNEEIKDSEKTTDTENKDSVELKSTGDKVEINENETEEEKTERVKKETKIQDYRTSPEEKETKEEKDLKETVPLSKYLDVKNKLKAATEGSSDINKETLEAFAEESGLKVEVVTKLASIISKQAVSEATRVAQEKVKPIIQGKATADNLVAFNNDFEKSIATKYPELKDKIDQFKKIAFSKDFLHLTSLEAIKEEFFPNAKAVDQKEVKKESVEGGSTGGGKETEVIDFKTLKDNPKQYEKVMKDEDAKKKYFAWQDEQASL